MADELKYIGREDETGLTLTAEIYGENGAQVGAAISATEIGTTAIYTADMPSVAAAMYAIRFFNGTTVVGSGSIDWNGTVEVTARELKADIAALNDFDPANDTVARVTLVDTVTTNTDMRGTDSANTVAPATPTDLANTQMAIILEVQQSEADVIAALPDVSGLATAAALSTVDTNVDQLLLDVAAIPSAPSAAAIYAEFTSGSNEDAFKADASGLSVDLSPVLTAINGLNDFDPVNDPVARVTLVDTTTANTDMRGTDNALLAASFVAAPTASEVYAEFVSGANEDAFKADVSNLAKAAPSVEWR